MAASCWRVAEEASASRLTKPKSATLTCRLTSNRLRGLMSQMLQAVANVDQIESLGSLL